MKSKATDVSSVVERHLCVTFPKFVFLLEQFKFRALLIPAHTNNYIFPAMASNRQVAFFKSRAHMFVGA